MGGLVSVSFGVLCTHCCFQDNIAHSRVSSNHGVHVCVSYVCALCYRGVFSFLLSWYPSVRSFVVRWGVSCVVCVGVVGGKWWVGGCVMCAVVFLCVLLRGWVGICVGVLLVCWGVCRVVVLRWGGALSETCSALFGFALALHL